MTSRVASATVHRLGDQALGNTSYLVEVGDGQAVVIDPPRDVDAHLALARSLGLQIAETLDTHLHADYLSGASELAARGSETTVPRGAAAPWARAALGDDERITCGRVALRALATPGHTPEHLSYVLEVDGVPQAVFTGGSLILGGAGRTDLLGDAHTDELAHAQFQSLRRLAELPDTTALYPTHGAGSFCLAASAAVTETTIGSERVTNRLLAIDDEDAFVEVLVSGFGTFPTYYRHLQALNQAGPPLLGTLGEPPSLTPEEVVARVEQGAWLIDARPIDEWASGHPVGAVSNELRGAFASWLGWLVPFGSPVVLIVDDLHRPQAVRLARRIGYDDLAFLDGGIAAWRAADLPTAGVDEVGPHEAHDRHRAGALLLDVRQDAELSALRIPGALHIELGDLIGGATPKASQVIAFCGHGERSATAASLLEARGLRVANLTGGITAWLDAGLPVER